jgi:tetratricopeptide (TPR) repeat protein
MSTRRPFPESAPYRAEIRAILALHRLWQEGKGESPEADALRDSTDGAWELLSESERERIRRLSEDLNSLGELRSNEPIQPMNPQAQTKMLEVTEARDRGQLDLALDLLRRWGKFVAPAVLASFRGHIWYSAGDQEVAIAFYRHALRLDPTNVNLKYLLFSCLAAVDPTMATAEAERVLQTPDANEPRLVIQAARMVFTLVGNAAPDQTVATAERLIPIVESAIKHLQTALVGDMFDLFVGTFMLGSFYRMRGDTQLAVACYSHALQIDPSNAPLYSARGILLYGTSPNAIADFETSIQLGFQEAWPFFFLAHYYVTHGRFEECRSMCERGLRRPGPDRVRSELLDWLAISQAELRFPHELVRSAFENALRADPSNDRAHRNYRIYEDLEKSQPSAGPAWDRISPSLMRSFGEELTRKQLLANAN